MAVSGLVALLDDLASIADDVAKMTALAADDIASATFKASQKAAGIVTDDLAVTAQTMGGIRRDRELRVVAAVAWGSLKNKMFYLVPGAIALSALAPWAIPPIMVGGGCFLAYEGAEKVLEKLHKHAPDDSTEAELPLPIDPVAFEKKRIDEAVRTDMVLSGEIMVMGLDAMSGMGMVMKSLTLPVFGLIMTFGVYGTVALLVKMDDFGEWLARKNNAAIRFIGRKIVLAAPVILRIISVVGTFAMLAVGGHLVVHNIPALEHLLEGMMHLTTLTGTIASLVSYVLQAVFGFAAGYGIAALIVSGIPGRLWDALADRLSVLRKKIR